MKKLKKIWLHISINGKLNTMIGFMFAVISVVTALNLYILNSSVGDIGQTLKDITACERVQEALSQEQSALQSYLENATPENRKRFEEGGASTKRALEALPYDYERIGADRYARTTNLKNAYEAYAAQRDLVVENFLPDTDGSIEEAYALLDRMEYLDTYIRSVMQLTVEDGSNMYESRDGLLNLVPYLQIVMFFSLFAITTAFGRAISGSIVSPLEKLAESAGQIEKNDFSGEDVVVENQDELGILVAAFDRMKHSMEENITTLQDNQILEERLHKEERERMELQNRLETARLDLLQSQINPHFLFNTLNTICGMAELEEAETTNRMIRSLSNIFRYNLHTTEAYLALTQELSVCEDYIYLQKMRFGERVAYTREIAPDIDTDAVIVPAFLLQPLVENAIGHGISKLENGGEIKIEVSRAEAGVRIEVKDTGKGIPADRLLKMREALESGETGRKDGIIGIGLGNTWKRISRIGSISIASEEGKGTTVTMLIPDGGSAASGNDTSPELIQKERTAE